MKKNIFIGCSSFYNRHWKKIFYPEDMPSTKWFEYYCQHFDTYEMNSTFYKAPTIKVLDNWYKKSPDNFLYSVKAPREITHIHKFINCEKQIENLYESCDKGLKRKLGNILFQFPPSYDFSPERLQHIINTLNLKFQNVIEFRHPSWWIEEVWNSFLKNNVTFCSVSHPQLPTKILMEFPVIYIRLHGRPKMFYSTYSEEELIKLMDLIYSNGSLKATFLYFNNTASEAGILNALEIKNLVDTFHF